MNTIHRKSHLMEVKILTDVANFKKGKIECFVKDGNNWTWKNERTGKVYIVFPSMIRNPELMNILRQC